MKLKLLPLGLLTALALAGTPSANAASVIWAEAATTISGDLDVRTDGTSVYAFALKGSGDIPTATVNGTIFTTLTTPDANLGVTAYDRFTWAGGPQPAPFGSLSSSYESILRSFWYATTPTVNNAFTLNNLTEGTYLLQIWFEDGRNPSFFPSVYTIGGVSSAEVDSNTTNTAGGLGQFMTGVVTLAAGETSFSFNATAGVSALQLRAIPEPSVVGALGLAGIALAAYRFRRVARS